MSKVLVVAVHPDDETLGCGGTLLKHKAVGDKIYWLIATKMQKGRGLKGSCILKREKEIKAVSSLYGFEAAYKLNLPTTQVDSIPRRRIIDRISAIFDKVEPNIVYLPFYGDVHSDHRVIFEASHSCLKPFRRRYVKKILMMETISETELALSLEDEPFKPNYLVDISGFLDKKIDIMRVFKGEMGRHPFPRSPETIKALATLRGSMAGCRYAEGFMVLREIV